MNDQSQDTPLASQQPILMHLAYPSEQGRSIDLLELLHLIWERKWVMVAIIAVFAILGVAWALLSTPIYRAEAVLAPTQSTRAPGISGRLGGLASLAGLTLNSGSDSTQAVAILKSRAFVEGFISENKLLPLLFPNEWDALTKSWRNENLIEQPNLWEGVKFFTEDVLFIEEDEVTGLVTLAVEWTDPEVAASWARQLVSRINDQLRSRDLAQSERKLEYLNSELEETNLLEVRQAITEVIEEQIQTITLAKGEIEYAFRTIDPPRTPMERARPKRTLIVVLAAMAGGLTSLCVAVVLCLVQSGRRPAA